MSRMIALLSFLCALAAGCTRTRPHPLDTPPAPYSMEANR